MNYGIKLKDIRTAELLTQNDIAKILKINRSTYKDYELQIKILPINHLNSICHYFNISIDYLLDLTNKKNYDNHNKEILLPLFTTRFKDFRQKNKLTQEKLASLLNTSHSMISDYEKGKKIISTPFLYTICKKYNISADYLLGKIDYIPNWCNNIYKNNS